jgi:hypothetical protein
LSADHARVIAQIIDASGRAERIEALLPVGVRPRQLKVRTLLLGMTLAMHQGRDAFLTEVHKTLLELPVEDQLRLGVIAEWEQGPHQLTYRQLEYTYRLIASKLANPEPDGAPSEILSEVLDELLEASVKLLGEPASSSYAVDWTDQETWSRPPPKKPADPEHAEPAASHTEPTTGDNPKAGGEEPPSDHANQDAPQADCADPEAAWGRRRGHAPGHKDESFFGYYLQAVTSVRDEYGPEVPELVRRVHLASCDHDPPRALMPTLERMAHSGINLGDILADSGYSYRVAEDWALRIRRLAAQLIQDLHPNDRGPHGTHHGATCSNGGLYCPATPKALLELGPLPRGASAEHTETHDKRCYELARYKLSPITGNDPDGYHRVICPAVQGKLRCPLRPASMTLPHDRPQVLTAPQHPPTCCQQQTITVPPQVNAKTAQKHDYPSRAHRTSYNRRSAAERTFSTITDRATNDLSRGWCRLMGLTPIALFTATAFIARNLRIADAFNARQAEQQQRAANGLPPKQRKRRRQTTEDLISAANAPP